MFRISRYYACSLFAVFILSLSGCGVTAQSDFDYTPPTHAATSSMSETQARQLVAPYFIQTGDVWYVNLDPIQSVNDIKRSKKPRPYVTTSSIILRDDNGHYTTVIPLSQIEVSVHECQISVKSAGKILYTGGKIYGRASDFFLAAICGEDKAKSMVEALLVLKQAAIQSQADEQRAFEQVSQSHSASMTRALPESARRYEVMAQDAVRDKKFDEAAEDYLRLIAQAPWWPQGYYNHALLLSNIGDYAHAITEMQYYLALAPTARNARAVQDKIYSWQRNLTQ